MTQDELHRELEVIVARDQRWQEERAMPLTPSEGQDAARDREFLLGVLAGVRSQWVKDREELERLREFVAGTPR